MLRVKSYQERDKTPLPGLCRLHVVTEAASEDILFSRSFPDKDVAPFMTIPLQELISLYNTPGTNNTAEMRYYDDQLPAEGTLLTYIGADKQAPQSAKQEVC